VSTQEDPGPGLQGFLQQNKISMLAAVAHRVVHGGERLVSSCRLDTEAEAEIERLSVLAPLHNPGTLRWLRAARALLGPAIPQVGVFDTSFYAHLPAVARVYAIPAALAGQLGARRYGFHGLAHRAMWQRWRKLQPVNGGGRVISLQLGAGCSVTATEDGVARDTSMGFSPLEGLVMATRCGDIDPGLVLYLQRHAGWSAAGVEEMLNEQSGLLGLSGLSGDMRVLLQSDDVNARLAVDLYCYRARKYIGAYMTVVGPPHAILFGGGVGENLPEIRRRILDGLVWCGVALDEATNATAGVKECCISARDSRVQVWVMPVDEEAVLAQEAVEVLAGD
jgi:acetate kinase